MCEHKFLITAKAAAKIAETNNKAQIKMVNDKIKKAAKEGLNYITIFDDLKQGTRELLTEAGYELNSSFNAYEDEIITIRW